MTSSHCLLESLWVCGCSLVYRLMGRVKEVKDSTAGPDNSYYTSLLNSKNDAIPPVSTPLEQGTVHNMRIYSAELSRETNFIGFAPHIT